MCGIAGFITKYKEASELSNNLEKALDEINYRGPDDKGTYYFGNVGLGHVRLSIIDLTSSGSQPMLDQSEKYVIIYNGELYNYQLLREKLYDLGVTFKSNSDTEVILESYKAWGDDAFRMFNGMFSFAILNKESNTLIIVRDRFGIKPLHIYNEEQAIYFSSEIKSILCLSEKEFELNKNVLPEWSYYGSALGNRTFYDGIEKILPGQFVEISLNDFQVETSSYWRPEDVKPVLDTSHLTEENVISNVRSLLEKSVESQLVADVPVGVFLSGGIDSSAITAFASKFSNNRIKTFSVGFDFDKGINELPKARQVAKKFGTEHHEMVISGYELGDVVQSLVMHHDSPFSDAANIPLMLLGREVNKDIKVVLQGDGGDELFAGYKRYQTLSRLKWWKMALPFIKLSNRFTPKNKAYFSRERYLNALSSPSDAELMGLLLTAEDRKCDPMRVFSDELKRELIDVDPFLEFSKCSERFSEHDIVQKMLLTDTQIILPDIFLDKVDRSTMAASIEVRVPFLDNELSEYVLSLPSKIKVNNGSKKWLLKKALDGVVPKDILYGPKTGFSVPYKEWLKGPLESLFNDNLLTMKNRNASYLNIIEIQKLYAEHRKGVRDHGFLLWKILNFMIWSNSMSGTA